MLYKVLGTDISQAAYNHINEHMLNTNSVRVGNVIKFNGKPCVVLKTQHTKPGKGGAFVQMELKDIIAGTKYNERFRSEDKVEKLSVDSTKYQYLYNDGDQYHFMDNDTYEQITLNKEDITPEKAAFLVEQMIVTVESCDDKHIGVVLPDTIIVEVADTEAVVKGQSASSSFKPATLTNGVKIMVPPFVNAEEKVLIKSEDLTYIERAK